MSTVVIMNPRASGARTDLLAVRAVLAEAPGLEGAEVHVTDEEGHARALAAEARADGIDLVVAAGGDGTVNEVVNGLMADDRPAGTGAEGRPVLGVLPLGTGNDLARSLGMPLDLDGALEAFRRPEVRAMDLLRLEQRRVVWCANHSAGGFSGRVDEELDDDDKSSWGPLAYLKKALQTLPKLESYETTVELDDEEERRAEVYSVVAANGRFAGGGIPVAPGALLDDGLMDVITVAAGALVDLGALANRLTAGEHEEIELLSRRRCRRLRVRSSPGMWFNADGELVGNEPAEIRVVPGALRVQAGPRGDRAFGEDGGSGAPG